MADFSQAQSFVKVAEGGYTNNPNDNGNWTGGKVGSGTLIGTNHGISAPVLSSWLGRTASVSDMKNLSYQTALQIYKRNYWDALNLDKVNNQSVALLIYDSGVNIGTSWVKTATVDSLNTVGKSVSKSDSWSTLVSKINQSDQQKFYNALWNKRKQKYDSMSSSPFYEGWMNRINRLAFFLTEKTQNIKSIAKRNRPVTILIVLLSVTAITGLLVFRKQIVNAINK